MKRLPIALLVLVLTGMQFFALSPVRAAGLAPDLDVSPSPVAAGGTITVTGNSFTSFAAVRVVVQTGGNTQQQLVAASGFGTFATTFRIPANTSPGTYRASAQVSTFTPIFANFTVVSGFQPPQLYTMPHTVAPGGIITLEGRGFRAFSAVRAGIVIPGPDQFQTVAANGQGAFTARFVVPSNVPTGIYRATAQVSTFTPVSVDFTVQANRTPLIYAQPNPVSRGQNFIVVGTHFRPLSSVRVAALFPQPYIVTVATNAQGTFVVRIVTPFSIPSGRYDLSAQVSTFTPVTADFWVR